MNKKIVLSGILAVLACIMIFGSTTFAHGKAATSGHSTASSASPRICYTVLKSDMKWVEPEECNNKNIPPDANGIFGFGAFLDGAPSDRHVQYNVYANGKWQGWSKDGDRIDTGGFVITAILVQLTPKKGWSLTINAVDKNGMTYDDKQDNEVVGNDTAGAAGLTKLRMKLNT